MLLRWTKRYCYNINKFTIDTDNILVTADNGDKFSKVKVELTGVIADDFRIVGYKNNMNNGTMTVYVEGDGSFSGYKNFTVKIAPKEINNIKAN